MFLTTRSIIEKIIDVNLQKQDNKWMEKYNCIHLAINNKGLELESIRKKINARWKDLEKHIPSLSYIFLLKKACAEAEKIYSEYKDLYIYISLLLIDNDSALWNIVDLLEQTNLDAYKQYIHDHSEKIVDEYDKLVSFLGIELMISEDFVDLYWILKGTIDDTNQRQINQEIIRDLEVARRKKEAIYEKYGFHSIVNDILSEAKRIEDDIVEEENVDEYKKFLAIYDNIEYIDVDSFSIKQFSLDLSGLYCVESCKIMRHLNAFKEKIYTLAWDNRRNADFLTTIFDEVDFKDSLDQIYNELGVAAKRYIQS